MLLEAFAKVSSDHKNARLTVVYKPTYYHKIPEEYKNIAWIRDTEYMKNSLLEMVDDLGIDSKVSFIEDLDAPTLYLEGADAFVVPFSNERFSSVNLVESLAFGLPVIATNIGEQRAILENSGCGLLVPPDDPAAMAAAMGKIAESPEVRMELGKRAESHAQNFSLDASAARIRGMYHDLLPSDS